MRLLTITLGLHLLALFSFSQELNFDEYLNQEEIIILKEKNDFLVAGDKAYLIDIIVSKDISYKINKAEGIPKLEVLVLPETFDPTFITHTSDIRRNAHDLTRVKVTKFSASVEKPDGAILPLQPEIRTISERQYTSSLGEIDHYEYRFKDLQEGDILTISYTYTFAFGDNWQKLFSKRVFFHSEFPKLSYDFSLTHSFYLPVDTMLVNLSPPVFVQGEKTKTYSWHMENLVGCLGEPGSRPYKELPQFIFSLKPYELIYEHWDSFIQEFVPLWLMLCLDREKDIRTVVIDNNIGAKDKDNLLYNKIARRFIDQVRNDSNGIKRLRQFQKWMVDTVKYDDALSYYDNQETHMVARPSKNLNGGTIRDFAIESTYATMILKLDLNFFTAYPCDKRFGEISDRYFAPLYTSDLLFAALLKDNIVSMVIPRSQYNQYYCEELPFYYEDIPVMLIHTNDFGGYQLNLLDSIRIMHTPGSSVADNFRKTKSNVRINLEKLSAVFTTTLTLSGQYSTLCRPVYFDKALDPTINPEYLHKVWSLPGEVDVELVKKEVNEDYFPFKTTIAAGYKANGLVEKDGNGYMSNLSDWLYHAGYDGFDPNYRFMDFYPDFVGTDHYIYQLTFNEEVELPDKGSKVEMNNDYFSYSLSIEQQSPTILSLMSYLNWKKSFIPKEEAQIIFSLLESIKKSKALFIRVVPK